MSAIHQRQILMVDTVNPGGDIAGQRADIVLKGLSRMTDCAISHPLRHIEG
ncbi:hypothetical protein [Serratia marcescens]|uniref:hypothetical protein n=1 Tax=Serratia marcescens TaxID=615 RepID=UPI0020C98ECD|nr:hypothetical protein [Serratia marcescens]MDY7605634.1 hypothetical protein [Serratia marcescens]